MNGSIPELAIVSCDGSNIFTRGDRYVIPLYQRPYAWGEEHIERLIEDIDDIPTDGAQKYYLGSLVVATKGNAVYEVIDGQQRLTTLFLLLSALGFDLGGNEPLLSFSCREKSDYTLSHLSLLASAGEAEDRLVEPNIAAGLKVVQDRLSSEFDDARLNELRAKLARTCLYRIEVPQHTDLNHYFEIMNTRGEQLEQHEVLKAWLMEPLTGGDAAEFASIWDACSDMSCYVQMRFGVSEREKLFGWGFDQFPSKKAIRSVRWGVADSENSLSIREIVRGEEHADTVEVKEDDDPSRFESIVDFRFFLIHALKVFVHNRGITARDERPLVDRLLDDKKLKSSFERVVESGVWEGESVDKARFSMEFVESLLQMRFLFDKCIIKREYLGGDLEGRWSLKALRRASKKSYRYGNTKFKRSKYQWSTTLDQTNRTVLMLQSCLRVSYTSPKVMHWVTDLLVGLMGEPSLAASEAFVSMVESCAQAPVEEYLRAGEFSLGVETPHVVLNYLDYVLWARDKGRYDDFAFEFRTSIEHWYPQNPSDGTFVRWDEVDRFGNLCLVQRNVNSKFSNLSPVAKNATFQEMIAGGSLKLRVMSELTNGAEDWKGGTCQEHEAAMLGLLCQVCGGEIV